jgi:hypothetical protein
MVYEKRTTKAPSADMTEQAHEGGLRLVALRQTPYALNHRSIHRSIPALYLDAGGQHTQRGQ